MADDGHKKLVETIEARRRASSDASYTRQLLDGGTEKCARKFGEEAVETVIAGLTGDGDALAAEAADVVYHLIVLLASRDVPWSAVEDLLASRMGLSGLDEKASRKMARPS